LRGRPAPSVEGGADGLRGARFVSLTNGCEIVTDNETAVKLVDPVIE